ncbi:MAG TPA: hypothetical protein DDZ80_29095, partial [Cyanobacteria bacterium UBA8803]|nr:hypothetical protein [Cyanobacteria bacterium UBA9273]HBL62309.1 hypothetical protein [Cyanobacteria bacterium UBA8803]
TYHSTLTGWRASGERVKRGLYKSRDGWVINADCNGSANIMQKVATQLKLNLAEVGRASLTVPQRIDLFSRLSKSYRKRSEASCRSTERSRRSLQTEA